MAEQSRISSLCDDLVLLQRKLADPELQRELQLLQGIENPQQFLIQKFGLFPIPSEQPAWGDLFKAYLAKYPEAAENFYGLLADSVSVEAARNAIERLLYLTPPAKYKERFMYFPLNLQSTLEAEMSRRFSQAIPQLVRDYPGLFNGAAEALFFHHGLIFLDDCVKRYLQGGVFFDCGAYDGASAIIMNKYQPSEIHLVEPSVRNIQKMRQNLANFVPDLKYHCHELCLGSERGEAFFDGEHDGSSRMVESSTHGVRVEVATLDEICQKHWIDNVRWIKADLEGEALNMIKGAKETICKNRPLLTLGVYHNPQEFLEIAPLLRSYVPEYEFAFRRCYTDQMGALLYGEETLIAYCPQPEDPTEWYSKPSESAMKYTFNESPNFTIMP